MGRRKEWDKCICHVTLCSSDPPCPCSEHHLFVLNTISINQINLGLPERRQKSEPFRHGEVLFKAKQLYLVFSINHDSPVTKRRHKRSPESESAETGTRNCGIQRSGAALHNSGKCVVVLLLLVGCCCSCCGLLLCNAAAAAVAMPPSSLHAGWLAVKLWSKLWQVVQLSPEPCQYFLVVWCNFVIKLS